MSDTGPRIYSDGSSYGWTPEMDDTIIRISKSTLVSTKWCAQQMWLNKNHPEVETELNSWLVIGNDVHYALEYFYDNAKPDELPELQARAKNGDMRLVKGALKNWLPSTEQIMNNRDERSRAEPLYERDYNHNIQWLLAHEASRLTHTTVENFLPVANEVILTPRIEVEGVPVQLVGIIDRVFLDDDGGLALMELKTGKWDERYKLSEMRMEMAFYKMLIENSDLQELQEKNLDRAVTHWGWRYSAADHVSYEKCKRVSERAMMKRLGDLVKMYLEESFKMADPNREGFKCARCEYMQWCPQYRSGDE